MCRSMESTAVRICLFLQRINAAGTAMGEGRKRSCCGRRNAALYIGVEMEMKHLQEKTTETIRLTEEEIEEYIQSLNQKGLCEASIQNYRATLRKLGSYLQEDKQIGRMTAARWARHLEEEGYEARTINARISVLNSFLMHAGKREWQLCGFQRQPKDVQPELSREEYRRLLSTARLLGKERVYLLIKTLGGAGVRMQELSQVTVEAVQKGVIRVSCHNQKRNLYMPAVLQKELLDFAKREGIRKGPLFVTRKGGPLSRSSVYHSVNGISKDAKVPEEKVNPRCLWKMYQNTYAGIQFHYARIAEQSYERMLMEEQLVLGWEEEQMPYDC